MNNVMHSLRIHSTVLATVLDDSWPQQTTQVQVPGGKHRSFCFRSLGWSTLKLSALYPHSLNSIGYVEEEDQLLWWYGVGIEQVLTKCMRSRWSSEWMCAADMSSATLMIPESQIHGNCQSLPQSEWRYWQFLQKLSITASSSKIIAAWD